MQIDRLQARASSESLLVEGKGKTQVQQQTAEQSEPAAVGPRATAPAPFPEPQRVTVSVDASRELVYRFLDPKTGEVVSQVPPEQVLEIVRGIQDLLRAADRAKVPSVNLRG